MPRVALLLALLAATACSTGNQHAPAPQLQPSAAGPSQAPQGPQLSNLIVDADPVASRSRLPRYRRMTAQAFVGATPVVDAQPLRNRIWADAETKVVSRSLSNDVVDADPLRLRTDR